MGTRPAKCIPVCGGVVCAWSALLAILFEHSEIVLMHPLPTPSSLPPTLLPSLIHSLLASLPPYPLPPSLPPFLPPSSLMTYTLICWSVLEAKRFCSAGQPADLPGADAHQSPACQRCGTVSVVLWYACQCLGATSCTTAFCRDQLLPRRCRRNGERFCWCWCCC